MGFYTRTRRVIYRAIHFHWLTERVQFWWRRDSILKVPAIGLELKVEPGDVIIDCGANVGEISSLFANSGATVYAFEPHPACFAVLRERFRAMPMVTCTNRRVMDERTTMRMSIDKPKGERDRLHTTISATFFPLEVNSDADNTEELEIECIDLSEFIRSLNRRIKLLKLDIEGSEVPVLNHMLDTGTIDLVDLTVVETHEKQLPHLNDAIEALLFTHLFIEFIGSTNFLSTSQNNIILISFVLFTT